MGKRGRTISMVKTRRKDKESLAKICDCVPIVDVDRPKVRGDCAHVPRPCPYVGCKYNLFLDVASSGESILFNYPGIEPHQMVESCALDVADIGGRTLEYIADLIGVSRERIRQIETMIFNAIEPVIRADAAMAEWVEEYDTKKEVGGKDEGIVR